jgi:hypothetical protein
MPRKPFHVECRKSPIAILCCSDEPRQGCQVAFGRSLEASEATRAKTRSQRLPERV